MQSSECSSYFLIIKFKPHLLNDQPHFEVSILDVRLQQHAVQPKYTNKFKLDKKNKSS